MYYYFKMDTTLNPLKGADRPITSSKIWRADITQRLQIFKYFQNTTTSKIIRNRIGIFRYGRARYKLVDKESIIIGAWRRAANNMRHREITSRRPASNEVSVRKCCTHVSNCSIRQWRLRWFYSVKATIYFYSALTTFGHQITGKATFLMWLGFESVAYYEILAMFSPIHIRIWSSSPDDHIRQLYCSLFSIMKLRNLNFKDSSE